MLKKRWLTAIVAVLFGGVTLLYFYVVQPNKKEALVPINEVASIDEIVTYDSDQQEVDRFYDVASPLFMSKKTSLPVTEFLSLMNDVDFINATEASFDMNHDVWLQHTNGEYSYLKLGYEANRYYIKDMKTDAYYAVSDEVAKAFDRLFMGVQKDDSFLKGLLVFLVLLVVSIGILEIVKARHYVVDSSKKRKTSEEFFVPLGIFFASIVIADFYGALHVLLVATTLFIAFALSDIKEKKSYVAVHAVNVLVIIALMYAAQIFIY